MALKKISMSFSGGEVTPEFWGQVNDAKFQSGLAKMRNFIALPHGPAVNRPGFGYVNTVKDITQYTRLIPFTYSTSQTMVLEFGNQYVRFHTQGATLLSGSVPYEVATPYVPDDLSGIRYVQSADVLTLVHPNYPPMELRRLGPANWSLSPITFVSSLSAPASTTATATQASSPSNLTNYSYAVTSVSSTGLEESTASPSASCTNNLLQTGAYNTITWPDSGAPYYNVYKLSNGLYGYIGQTNALSFVDDNITADLSKTPPIQNNPFAGPGYYPGAVSYFQQRRCFAGSYNEPQNLRMTRSGTESNMSYSIPTRDDDAINVRVAAREANTIQHIVPLASLVLLTGAAEWRVASLNSDVITPSSIGVMPQSYIGAGNAQPVVVNNNILYSAARGGHMREMAYSYQAGGYVTGDLSLRAPHLFDGNTIIDMAFAKAPWPILWAVSSSGKLLGMTYVPEQQIGAWHEHDSEDGVARFESCCVVAEGNEDVLYVIVARYVSGQLVRYVERMTSRMNIDTAAQGFFVDSGGYYSGTATTVVNGLGWLEGKTVSILGDGAVMPQQTVVGGKITLSQACSTVSVGLPITADLQTLPLYAQVDNGLGMGRVKNVNKVWVRVVKSSGVKAGPDEAHLTEFKQRRSEAYGAPPDLRTGVIEIVLDPSWQDDGQVLIRQTQPLPVMVTAITLECEVGG